MIGRVEETSASSKPGPRLDSTRLRGARDETRVPTATSFCCGAYVCSWQILLQKLFALVICELLIAGDMPPHETTCEKPIRETPTRAWRPASIVVALRLRTRFAFASQG